MMVGTGFEQWRFVASTVSWEWWACIACGWELNPQRVRLLSTLGREIAFQICKCYELQWLCRYKSLKNARFMLLQDWRGRRLSKFKFASSNCRYASYIPAWGNDDEPHFPEFLRGDNKVLCFPDMVMYKPVLGNSSLSEEAPVLVQKNKLEWFEFFNKTKSQFWVWFWF